MNESIQSIQEKLITFFLLKGVEIVGALIILLAGFVFARWLGNLLKKWLDKRDLEPPVRMLMVRIVRILIISLTMVIMLEKLGVPIAPMIAGIGVAGIGIGLAMQGLLSNIVAGLMIIFTKPFKVGEYVELVGVHGMVSDISLFTTILTHTDRSHVVIPNRKIVGEILHNYGTMRQLDLTVGVAYSCNPAAVLATVREVLANNPHVLKQPEPVVGISVLADSSINVAIRPWVKVPDYGAASAEIYLAVVETFRARQIEIPFPQREIRLLSQTPPAA
jgi:small conductance mechanosensitive channel